MDGDEEVAFVFAGEFYAVAEFYEVVVVAGHFNAVFAGGEELFFEFFA